MSSSTVNALGWVVIVALCVAVSTWPWYSLAVGAALALVVALYFWLARRLYDRAERAADAALRQARAERMRAAGFPQPVIDSWFADPNGGVRTHA